MTYALVKRESQARDATRDAAPRIASRRAGEPARFPVVLQPKLVIGAQNDPLEREADAVAEQVVRMNGREDGVSLRPAGGPEIQRSCATCDGEDKLLRRSALRPKTRKCDRCAHEEDEGTVRRMAEGWAHELPSASSSFAERLTAARSAGGTPLESATRSFMEPRFGADFSGIRVHRGHGDAALADEIGARAFTVGRDIFFARRAYDPDSIAGRRLLAHELVHTQQQDRSRIRRAPKTAAASRAEAEKKAIEDRSTGPSPEYWQCRVPESDVAAVAGPGVFYQTKGGDTLRSIAAQVRGTTSDAAAAGDETDLLPAARIINDHPCNVKFHRRSRAASDRGQFFGTQILIRGVFADTLAGQASSHNGGQGGGYPIIRIPPAYYRGDLAGAEGWNMNDRSGIGGPGANAGGSAFVGRSCSEYVDIRDPSRQCDLTDKIEAIWAAAERMASTAYAAFPRLDAGGPSPPAKVLEALAHSFALRKDQLRDPAMFPALREIRANFGSISALLKRRAIRIECDSGGNEWGTCESPSGVVGASANRSGYMVLCAATLLGSEMSHSKGGIMIRTFYASTWDQIALTMIHEVAHYTLVGAADKHYHPGNWSGLEPVVAVNTPDAYAQFAKWVGETAAPTFGPLRCST